MADSRWPISETRAAYVVVVTLLVVLAAVVAPIAWNLGSTAADDNPTVQVVTLRGGTNDANVNAVANTLRNARTNDSVAAVVLRVDSPGGPVAPSEELYLAVNRTAAEMPVVAYVEGAAASGGYYGIAPADEIYVKPSSTVGSIGVIVQAPLSAVEQAEQVSGTYVRSGPDKAQIDQDRLREDLERLQRAFVETVMTHRGDDLSLSREEVANGRTYLGTQAVQNGFADRIGDSEAAIEAAADRSARIDGDNYDVAYTTRQVQVTLSIQAAAVDEVGGNTIYYTDTDTDTDAGESAFVRPVRYYAVWGVPVEATAHREGGTDE
ncbi:peptidase [Halobellus salinus]|uniref:Peptidase n=1 Tax=Halobellus salinus TaxID=931585 RepID=A0A830ESY4_9EURY|nr:S49 family peptidase [Halobellus salinus]GGJ14694.1 peptidase [Halobellus salinus]SMP15467.1 protease-4 [Halobellus salinus]